MADAKTFDIIVEEKADLMVKRRILAFKQEVNRACKKLAKDEEYLDINKPLYFRFLKAMVDDKEVWPVEIWEDERRSAERELIGKLETMLKE